MEVASDCIQETVTIPIAASRASTPTTGCAIAAVTRWCKQVVTFDALRLCSTSVQQVNLIIAHKSYTRWEQQKLKKEMLGKL